eukprot:TRINITY_DN59911_c0_g1_i2.p1 TRINITY_DN59911_c0_g1~~TRINITY_DN59911_c0_g1_i2.p1  ORF type:complete len:350 (+),score=32.40 TRINITY_DN59911_c0_g1_i2:155-1204(+)
MCIRDRTHPDLDFNPNHPTMETDHQPAQFQHHSENPSQHMHQMYPAAPQYNVPNIQQEHNQNFVSDFSPYPQGGSGHLAHLQDAGMIHPMMMPPVINEQACANVPPTVEPIQHMHIPPGFALQNGIMTHVEAPIYPPQHGNHEIQAAPESKVQRPTLTTTAQARDPNQSRRRKLCEHRRRPSQCKECGGSGICVHGRQRNQCKQCGGCGICEHGRIRSRCKDCGGRGICEHGRQRNRCKVCGKARELAQQQQQPQQDQGESQQQFSVQNSSGLGVSSDGAIQGADFESPPHEPSTQEQQWLPPIGSQLQHNGDESSGGLPAETLVQPHITIPQANLSLPEHIPQQSTPL